MHIVTGATDQWLEYPVPQKMEGIEDEGFQYELRHMQQCIREGLSESPIMTWAKSRKVLEICDQLRAEWKLKYPFEE